MSIRSTAKAILLRDGKILLNRCEDPAYGLYYSLPGGGQNDFEPLEDALVRECLEETGYTVKPIRLAAVCESCTEDPVARAAYPDYAHRMFHIFLCEPVDEPQRQPTEQDSTQVSSEWIPVEEAVTLPFRPAMAGKILPDIIAGKAPLYLGWEAIK